MVFEKLFRTEEKKGTPAKKKSRAVEKPARQEDDAHEGWIRCKVVIEILGAPKEHVEETMKMYLHKIKEEKNCKIVDEHISKVEAKEKFFAQFAELEILFKKPVNIIEFCFDYMPSSVEIIAPEDIAMKAFDLSGILNDLQARLHQLDMVVKTLSAENKLISDNARAILRNNMMISLKEKDKEVEELARNVGLEIEVAKRFLEELITEGFIKQKKGKYGLAKSPPELVRKPVEKLSKK